ncbi:MAG: hypothetical protein KC657_20440 [Myxococcales bacterium]|nr:hypothetical protein [Myxococcales bacterium]
MLEGLAPLTSFALGLRHALEPDHVSAVGTLATERDPKGGVATAAYWGAGHAASLVVVGVALALTRTRLSESTQGALEAVVGCTLFAVGARALWRARTELHGAAAREHTHGDETHVHAGGAHPHVHVLGGSAVGMRALFVGIVHGLAGSGAVTAAALGAGARSFGLALALLVAQAVGTLAGMVALSLFAAPLIRRLTGSPRAGRALLLVAGVQSCALGVFWAGRALAGL